MSQPIYTLTVNRNGTGSGTVGGGGAFAYNATVTPTASAAAGSTLTGWTPTSCASPFALVANTTCTATFSLPAPDFEISELVLTPHTPRINGTFTANITVTNGGTAAGAAGPLQVWAHQPTGMVCGAVGNQTIALPIHRRRATDGARGR